MLAARGQREHVEHDRAPHHRHAITQLARAVARVVYPRARVSVVLEARLATRPPVWAALTVRPGAAVVRLSAVVVFAVLVAAAICARDLGLPGRVASALSAAANAASSLALWRM